MERWRPSTSNTGWTSSLPAPTTAALSPSPPSGGKSPTGQVPITIGDETGHVGKNTTPDQIAATVSRVLQRTITPAEIIEKNPGLIRNGRTTAGFNGDQCLNY